MVDYCKDILDKLNKTQYSAFLKISIGFKSFIEHNDFYKGKLAKTEKSSGNVLIGELCSSSRKTKIIVKNDDYEHKSFHDDKNNLYEAYSYFDSLGDDVIYSLLMTVFGIDGNDNASKLNHEYCNGVEVFKCVGLRHYSFILGAGINMDPSLNVYMGSWEALVNSMRVSVMSKLGLTNESELRNFEKSICNTNYIAPQILRSLDKKTYFSDIYSNLYSVSYNPSNLDVTVNAKLSKTSLYQIARIMSKQKAGSILTFNYDDLLETIFANSFSITPQSVYRYSSKTKSGSSSIKIVHSHGFFPYANRKSKPHSIVLSSYEYMEGYSKNRYPRKTLFEQLKHTNILIGNSLSDYEEQKVFYSSFENCPSRWHFMFTKKSESDWMNAYKTCYFMNMGVIPVYFDDYPDIEAYLESL